MRNNLQQKLPTDVLYAVSKFIAADSVIYILHL